MEKWELSLNKFLDDYINQDYFVGALLTGSYATGNQNNSSDIDIYIITKDTLWRERGNKLVDGYMIEYFINPINKIKSYFSKETETLHLSTTMMFVNGKILYDKDDVVKNLVKEANNNINKDFNNIDEFNYKLNCYSVWDGFDELYDKYIRKQDIDFSYNIFLDRIISSYFSNKRIPSLPSNKIESILKNKDYRKKYNIIKMPDNKFCELLLNCFNEKEYNKRIKCARKIYNYFFEVFNDFDINNFALRSSAE